MQRCGNNMTIRKTKTWNKKPEDLNMYEVCTDYYEAEKITPCNIKAKIPIEKVEIFKQLVLSHYDLVEASFSGDNDVFSLKIPYDRDMLSVNVYSKTGIVTGQGEINALTRFSTDVTCIIEELNSNPVQKEVTRSVITELDKSFYGSEEETDLKKPASATKSTDPRTKSMPNSVDTNHNLGFSTPCNKTTDDAMMNTVNRSLERLKAKSLSCVSEAVLINKLNKVDSLEQALVDFKGETNNALTEILKCIKTIQTDQDKKLPKPTRSDVSLPPHALSNTNTDPVCDIVKDKLIDPTVIYESEDHTVQGSVFKAFASVVQNREDAFKFFSAITTSDKMGNAEHFYSSYCVNNTTYDTHEDPGSKRIKGILKKNSIQNVAVIVTRHFGNVHIYNQRWDSTELVTLEVLQKMGYIHPSSNHENDDTSDDATFNVTLNQTQGSSISLSGKKTKKLTKKKNQKTKQKPNLQLKQESVKVGVTENYSSGDSDIDSNNSEENCESDVEVPFQFKVNKNSDPTKQKFVPEVVLICDSVGKEINDKQFFGSAKVSIRSAHTLPEVKNEVDHWQKSNSVSKVIFHCGINDVKAKRNENDIVNDISSCIDSLHHKFPKAQIAFSGVICNPKLSQPVKSKIQRINSGARVICESKDVNFVYHSKLCSNEIFFKDMFHINENGTKVFVKHITSSFRSKTGYMSIPKVGTSKFDKQKPHVHKNPKKPQYSDGNSKGYPKISGPTSQYDTNPPPNMNEMLKIMTLQLLQNIKM